MAGHKFTGDPARLDNPKRQGVFPIEPMVEALGDIEDGLVVADLGCGTGYLSIPLAKHIEGRGKVYAVDINPSMLSIVKEKAVGLNNIEAIKSEENSFPIPSNAVDVSYMVAVFHEIEDPAKFLMEIRRISKPFHRIIVVDWNQVEGEMGPPMRERIPEKDAIKFFKDHGYALLKRFEPSRYVYGLEFCVPTCKPLDRVWM